MNHAPVETERGMPDVILQVHTDPPRRVVLAVPMNLVGRDEDNTVQIDHPSVSGRHCALLVQADGTLVVRDMGSTNGTFIDGARITASPLGPYQVLTLGEVPVTLEPREGATELAEDTPEITDPLTLGPAPRPPAPKAKLARMTTPRGTPWVPATSGDRVGTGMAMGTLRVRPAESFGPQVAGAFVYALQEDAWMLILGIAFLQAIPALLPGPFGMVALGLNFLVVAYVLSLLGDILRSTIAGEDRVPSITDFSYNWDDIRDLLTQWLVPCAIAFGPAIMTEWVPGTPRWLTVVLAVMGCCYAPMAILGVLVSDSLGAASPGFVVRSILRAPLDYVVLVVVLACTLAMEFILELLPNEALNGRGVMMMATVATTVVSVYMSLVWVRLLGLYYRCNRDRLCWTVGSDEDGTPI